MKMMKGLIRNDKYDNGVLVESFTSKLDGTRHGVSKWYKDGILVKSIEYDNGKVKKSTVDDFTWFQMFEGEYIFFDVVNNKIKMYSCEVNHESPEYENISFVNKNPDGTFSDEHYKFTLNDDHIDIENLYGSDVIMVNVNPKFSKVQEHDGKYFHIDLVDGEVKRYAISNSSDKFYESEIRHVKKVYKWFIDSNYRFRVIKNMVIINDIKPGEIVGDIYRFNNEEFKVNAKGELDDFYEKKKDNGVLLRKIKFKDGKLDKGVNWFEHYMGKWYHFIVKDNNIQSFLVKDNIVSMLNTDIFYPIGNMELHGYKFSLDMKKLEIKINEIPKPKEVVLIEKNGSDHVEYHGIDGIVKMIKYYRENKLVRTVINE